MSQLSEAGQAVGTTPTCDRGEVGAPCGAKAVFGYQWDWGEKGHCCAEHATLLQQIGTQISRGVTLHPLHDAAPAPLLRDERTKLKAAALVLEEELEEAKSRGLDLYRINTQLRGDVNLLKVRNAEADAQLKDARAEVELLTEELAKREREAATMALELDRLQSLAAFTAEERTEAERRELGLSDDPEGSRVDG